ncbi:MAG TPA: malto-oligosyltrehalose synthase, partial [Bacteroidales bacterium]|nr:malto-oligosyltrehalose synthase [Bacteroidales bacterium]
MYTPSSTYRIQFNNQYTFKKLSAQLPYLSQLGIGAIYASPVFAAVPGSNHGYDVTNSKVFNKEIGTAGEFKEIREFLIAKNIGWIQDIVPNHMAFHPDNAWLMDVLEKGRLSAYAGYFDIDWDHPDFHNKVMIPILGKSLEQAVNDKEIKLLWQNGSFLFSYYDFKVPASGESFHEILEQHKVMEESYFVGQGIAKDEYKSDPAFRGFGWSNNQQRLQAIYETDNSFGTLIDHICDEINSDPERLLNLLSDQHFVLTHWQEVESHLNYRRFFTINGLICLGMEKPDVFEDYHSFILENVQSGNFNGLRIDHVDGLKNPNMYFERLRASVGEDTFVVVEKILEHEEELLKDWPLEGTSGYDFLAIVNNVFTHRENLKLLKSFYRQLTGFNISTDDTIYEKKKMILRQSFSGDLDNICRTIESSGLIPYSDKITPATLREAAGEFLVNCPVYKLYSSSMPLEPEDALAVREIIRKSIERTPELEVPLNKLKEIFTEADKLRAGQKALASGVFLKLMQYTGPIMAKGVEDTAMYTWGEFIAHNEVGDSIDAKGLGIEELHLLMTDRQNHYPKSINATATHDTKRGEDARARLNVLSDFASEWMQLVRHWTSENKSLKTLINGNPVPDVNEEYFVYQTLAGVFPMTDERDPGLPERLKNYFEKALREAKVHSNWNKPDEAYEKAFNEFVDKLLEPSGNFFAGFQSFLKKIIPWGITNSLSQVVLKCTCPGIPDFYQGTELWDLSLVDPDNRREVDYNQREIYLNEIQTLQQSQKETFLTELLKTKEDGKIKLWVTHQLMKERSSVADFFTSSDYEPLHVRGEYKDHLLGFVRKNKNTWYATIVPISSASLPLSDDGETIDWKDTTISFPHGAPKNWKLIWDNSSIHTEEDTSAGKLMRLNCPVVLKGEQHQTGRGSGILLHITSLAGNYGAGDLGNSAYAFVDALKKAKQSYWQILPFNPVGGTFSPYSSSSAFAGNTMFISPEILFKQKLLKKLPDPVSESAIADFSTAEEIRSTTLREAFNNYVDRDSPLLKKRFEDFCATEKDWLNDFALFNVFKKEFNNKPWNEWPENIKIRNSKSIALYQEKNTVEITRIKFAQYLFSVQFRALKSYANRNGIKIIGDMPIYVSFDSADVWASPHLFELDAEMNMKTVAGVPPDYFSETGQLWNMPIYNWQTMEKENYEWWTRRISKNLKYADILRFDHFRGFSSYWEVPAKEKTAINGRWVKGPAAGLFNQLKKTFPEMPFIAEDLGDIDEDVYKLRDDFHLPGMKVLQFAFGDNLAESVHIPHMHIFNSIVYTGTHDNNTIKGWYKKEISRDDKKRITY